MKTILLIIFLGVSISSVSQGRQNPAIKTSGSIFDVPDADVKPDPSLKYNIVIEMVSGSENSGEINQALNNVARLINLHVIGGVPKENLDVAVVIHGEATYTITDSKAYSARYHEDNPNLELYKELADFGVKFIACGQSLIARNVERSSIIPQIRVGTSMLTTVTTYQLKGYAFLKF